MIKGFQDPSNQFRPIPFWSWNDQLDPQELRHQIQEMKKAGVGGYFMHARSGLKTPYLSEEWFECIQTGIQAGKEVGLDAWAYDEEGWPSGFAGGLVPAISADFHAKYMTLETVSGVDSVVLDHVIALYRYHPETRTYSRINKDDMAQTSSADEVVAVISHANAFYIDTLNKRAVEAFLETTHEAYYERFGKDFGTGMRGFFTDEPRLTCDRFGDLPWSDDLPEAFLTRHSYDLLDHLPSLFRETEQYEKVRYDFWTTVNSMFVNHYMKTIYDWCEAHECQSTGHIMMEESIFSQMTSTAGVMPFYEYLHKPGIDWLRRMIASPVIGKQVGSVACQLGKKQILTETFALCGWNVSFEELKWIADWQFVNGVNQICQHLQGYTIKGIRKRDYPPSLFLQQTWWEEYRKFNDYLGRICVALSEGDQTADVLLIHPMRSGYIAYDGTRTEAIRTLDERFEALSTLLSGLHISYHFGDETIIERHGSVQGAAFVVGRVTYKTVILPPMYAIDTKTLALLIQFGANGGTILSMGQLPTYTNGEPGMLSQLQELARPVNEAALRPYLLENQLAAISIAQAGEEIHQISYLQREAETSSIYFFANHSQQHAFQAQITLLGRQGTVIRLVGEDGSEETLTARVCDGNTIFHLPFEPMQSHVIQLVYDVCPEQEGCADIASVSVLACEPETITVSTGEGWEIEQMDLNTMTLDFCDYRIDEGTWHHQVPVIKLQNLLLDLQRPCEVEMAFPFHVSANLEANKEFYAVIEDAGLYEIAVNGQRIPAREEGWWKDKSFKKVTIKPYLQSGRNVLTLKTEFKQPQKVYDVLYGENVYETEKNKITLDIEIESIYLLGDFGVVSNTPFQRINRNAMVTGGGFDIVDAPTSFPGNDFTSNGLLFFAGKISVFRTLEIPDPAGKRVILNIDKHHAPFVKVYVNDVFIKDSLWAPYTADITKAVHVGTNTLKLVLFASNRNLLGPHHHIDGECYNVGPESFTGKWSWVERKSEADATEIHDTAKNYWTDSYCFVEFGPASCLTTYPSSLSSLREVGG